MKRQAGFFLIMAGFLLLSAFPAFAGEWKLDEEDKWYYLQDDGTKAVGWLKIDEDYFYLDEDGSRKEDFWLKDKGYWYYLDEDGILATSTWVDNYYVNEEGKLEKKR